MWVWTGFCIRASWYKYKVGSKLSCYLLKKCCRWKMSFKIVEQNVGLDARDDIDKDVKGEM